MSEMHEEYQRMLDQGIYDDEEDLMNQEGLSYDDLYKDEDEEEGDNLGNRYDDDLDQSDLDDFNNDFDDDFNKDFDKDY